MSGSIAANDPVTSILQALPCGCLLLRDSLAASGHFLLPWITAASLSQGHKVVFVAAAYSPTKHKAALKKIGAPGLSSITSSSSSSIAFVSPADAEPLTERRLNDLQHLLQQQDLQRMPRLQRLYQQVAAAARQLLSHQEQQQQQQQQQQLSVVIDSLTVLASLVCDEVQASAFMHYMMALGEVLQVPCRLILLAATDIPADAPLLAAAAVRAHVIADVAPLEGRTAALDGSLTITVKKLTNNKADTVPGLQGQVGAGQQQCTLPSWLQPGSSSVWFFRAGDVGIKWLPQVHGKEIMA